MYICTRTDQEDVAILKARYGKQICFIPTNLGASASLLNAVEQMKQSLRENNTRLDAVLNFATHSATPGPILELEDQDFIASLQQNVVGVWLSIKLTYPLLQPGARVIIIIKEAAHVGALNLFHLGFDIPDRALLALICNLRTELNTFHIKVVCVAHGVFISPLRFLTRYENKVLKYTNHAGNSPFVKLMVKQAKLCAEYCSTSGFCVPLSVYGSTLYWAIHSLYPKDEYACNISWVMTVSSILPEVIAEYLIEIYLSEH